MGCEGILRDMEDAGLTANARLIFWVVRHMDYCKGGGKLAVAREWLRAQCGFTTDMPVRNGLRALAKAGWIATAPDGRKYTTIKLLRHRQPIQETIQETIQENTSKKQLETTKPIQLAIQETIHRDVGVGSVVSPAVDTAVSHSVGYEENVKGRAQSARPAAAREAKRLDEMALAREASLPDVVKQIEALYGGMSGFKFPWQKGKDFVRLAEKCQQFTPAVVLAACDYFFHPANEWATRRGYRIDEFMHQFSELLLRRGIKARAAQYASNTWSQMPAVSAADISNGQSNKTHHETEAIPTSQSKPAPKPPAQVAGPKEPDLTDDQLHEITVTNLHKGRCPDPKCSVHTRPAAAPPVAAMAGAGPVKRESPF